MSIFSNGAACARVFGERLHKTVLFIALAISASAETTSTTCQSWNKLDGVARLSYLRGVNEGMLVGLYEAELMMIIDGKKNTDKVMNSIYIRYFDGKASYADLLGGINVVCSDPHNSSLDATIALKAYMFTRQGMSRENVEQYLRELRPAVKDKQ